MYYFVDFICVYNEMIYTITYKSTYIYDSSFTAHSSKNILIHLLHQCHSNVRPERMSTIEKPLLSRLVNGFSYFLIKKLTV